MLDTRDQLAQVPDLERFVAVNRKARHLRIVGSGALFDLSVSIGAPTNLQAIGMPEDGIDEAARRIVLDAAGNVRRPEFDGIRSMLIAAFRGGRP